MELLEVLPGLSDGTDQHKQLFIRKFLRLKMPLSSTILTFPPPTIFHVQTLALKRQISGARVAEEKRATNTRVHRLVPVEMRLSSLVAFLSLILVDLIHIAPIFTP